MKVARYFHFDAGHFIKDDKGSPCEAPHGHTYKLRVVVVGEIGEDGMVIDFRDIKKIVKEKVLKKLDHKDLNAIFGNPTTELVARWIFDELKPHLDIVSVRLWEGEGKWAEAD